MKEMLSFSYDKFSVDLQNIQVISVLPYEVWTDIGNQDEQHFILKPMSNSSKYETNDHFLIRYFKSSHQFRRRKVFVAAPQRSSITKVENYWTTSLYPSRCRRYKVIIL